MVNISKCYTYLTIYSWNLLMKLEQFLALLEGLSSF